MIVGDEIEIRRSFDHAEGGPVHEIRSVRPSVVPALAENGDDPEKLLDLLLRWLLDATTEKNRIGQAEHGGVLSHKPRMLAEAEDEAIDQATYLFTLRRQLGHALGELEACIASWGARDGSHPIDHAERARDILAAVLER